MQRRQFIHAGAAAFAGLSTRPGSAGTSADDAPILVAIELSGGNDGLNCIVPFADDAYYRHRPTIGIKPAHVLKMDGQFGMNPGMTGMHRLWQQGKLAVVHGCGYAQPSYSHFTSMAYWHTGAPNQGNEHGWMGRLADVMDATRRDNMLINVASAQSLAVKSARHTPVVFDDPNRFQRHRWMASQNQLDRRVTTSASDNPARDFLHAVNASAQASSAAIRAAWRDYNTDVDYGILPMDLPKVAACIAAGLPTQLYYVSFDNNAFDTHVNQPALHRRLLSYASDGIYGFIRDLERIGQSKRVLLMVFSEFGRRVPENANLGTDHGTANVMFMIGAGVRGGHYGEPPSLTALVDGDNLQHTTDFRRVYASAINGWLGVDAQRVLNAPFEPVPVFG